MAFRWQWLLILLALSTGGERSFAASAREDRAYAAAVTAFQDGMWGRAETEFAQFVQKYPKSDRRAGAVLLQAEAEYQQGKLPEAIALLTARKAEAGNLADQYVYWIGEAQYTNKNYSAAADTFVSLTRDFPESSLRLRAVMEAAAAYAQLRDWRNHDALLENTNGIFRRAAQLDPGNELVVDGQLSLGNSKYQQRDFPGVVAVYELLTNQWPTLNPGQQCQGTYLYYLAKMELGDFAAALAATTNLAQLAGPPTNQYWLALARASRGAALKKMDRLPEAIQAWHENLTDAPVTQKREAFLKIAELEIVQGQLTNAGEALTNFLAQFRETDSADIALLTAGELHLKNYAALPAATNHLSAAQECFDQFLRVFPNSPLTGKAYLNRGWCEWFAKDMTNSLADFQKAAKLLPPSEDLAVARFKTGDALFALTNYAGALENYRAVRDDFTNFPAVARALGDLALYQMLRANLELKDLAGASSAMAQILKLYPTSDLADNSILLVGDVGEGLADARQPAAARALFRKFAATSPNSPLRSQVELAVARTYEREQDWPSAIGQYENWRNDFPTDALRPQADYALARANFQAGNEMNAFGLFTNFIVQFPTNELAPLAQYWVAEHYFRLGGTNYMEAERNYKMLYQNTNWQRLPPVYTNLPYQARLMAGRAAMGLPSYTDAIDHFTSLTSDTNCPSDLNAQALFAYGSALMLQESPDTNKPLANFQLAMKVFSQICQLYPTNEPGALAWCEIGDCALQLTNYDAATNAYAQVFNPPFANISARSRAQIGFGLVLEKKAALAAGGDQTALLQAALDNYLDVLYKNNLRDGEQPDEFWTKKAGLQAAPLVEVLGVSDLNTFYNRMEERLPQLKDWYEKKKAAAQGHLPPVKN
jgi:TolA-binding protein